MKTYTPNINVLLNRKNAIYTVELRKGWFRILRILNQKKTHDFIFYEKEFSKIKVANSNYNSAEVLCNENELKNLFKDKSIYLKYDRPKGNIYNPRLDTIISIEHLMLRFQNDIF